jgi:hypothetical protein
LAGVIRLSARTNDAPTAIAVNGNASSARATRCTGSPSSDSTSASGAYRGKRFAGDHSCIAQLTDNQRANVAVTQRRAYGSESFGRQPRAPPDLRLKPIGDVGHLAAVPPIELRGRQLADPFGIDTGLARSSM